MSEPRIVVGALICDSFQAPTRVLAARRTGPDELAGRWEFPGGKVEHGESPEEALRRELMEELGIEATVGRELVSASGAPWPISESFVMRLYFSTMGDQIVTLDGSHDEVRWIDATELHSLNWLESDRAALPYVFDSQV